MLNQPHSSFTRIPYTQRCRVQRGERSYDGVLCNISVLGVYLTLDDIPEVGAEVRLSFPLPGSADPIDVAAVVSWQNLEEPATAASLPAGCGLRFLVMSPDDRGRIERLVADHKDRLPFGIGAATPQSGYVRVPFIQRSKIVDAGTVRSAVVCNISTLGAYVTIDPIPPRDSVVEVAFLLPGDPRTFRCRATVAWQNPLLPQKVDSLAPGCGLRFDDVPHVDRLRLERVVRDYCTGLTPRD
jgi:Tfp pilus assembly protein PilZ